MRALGARCRRELSTSQQPEQALDVITQCDHALGDRPDPIEQKGIDGQAAESGQDLDTVVLPVAVCVFSQRHVPHPVPAVFDRPAPAACS